MESIAHVGMDVDKEKIAIAVVKDYESVPRLQRVIRNRHGYMCVQHAERATSTGCYQGAG
jgi:hypothetical protein